MIKSHNGTGTPIKCNFNKIASLCFPGQENPRRGSFSPVGQINIYVYEKFQ